MARFSPDELALVLGRGLLSFPVTAFDREGGLDLTRYQDHCAWLLERPIAGLFAAGGTGEFFSLTLEEVAAVVQSAVEVTDGRVPVIAGCGYGTAMAVALARAAESAGADGVLLLPPYLVNSSEAGLEAHVAAVCAATRLGVIMYNRDNAILGPEALSRLAARWPNFIGFKDGVGDLELMTRIVSALGDRLVYIGGLPTAETFATPYLKMGVSTYSSAIFNFAPDWALLFYDAVRRDDQAFVALALRNFVLPWIEIRNRGRGYAVSMIKAGLEVVGRSCGGVRPPLLAVAKADFEELSTLIRRTNGDV
ncbi:MAG: 5-dehydro-4-deoxyglucarate dehydratase [Caulobacterales bacterium]